MNLTAAQKSTTLEEYSNYKNDGIISYESLSLVETVENISYPVQNVLTTDYIKDLKKLAVSVEFSSAEYNKYKYKPKLLANNFYGNPELHFVIMALNDIASVKDFDFKIVKLLTNDDMKTFVSAIFNSEKDKISEYNSNK